MKTLTAYECYRSMTWTTDSDECEAGCGQIMSEGHYVEGSLGHYCSHKCLLREESADVGSYREDFHADG